MGDFSVEQGCIEEEEQQEEEQEELAPVPVLRYNVSADFNAPAVPIPAPLLHQQHGDRRGHKGTFSKRMFGSPEATPQISVTFEEYWGAKCHTFAVAALVRAYT